MYDIRITSIMIDRTVEHVTIPWIDFKPMVHGCWNITTLTRAINLNPSLKSMPASQQRVPQILGIDWFVRRSDGRIITLINTVEKNISNVTRFSFKGGAYVHPYVGTAVRIFETSNLSRTRARVLRSLASIVNVISRIARSQRGEAFDAVVGVRRRRRRPYLHARIVPLSPVSLDRCTDTFEVAITPRNAEQRSPSKVQSRRELMNAARRSRRVQSISKVPINVGF